MKRVLFLVFWICTLNLSAQQSNGKMIAHISGTGSQQGLGVTSDDDGNLIFLGKTERNSSLNGFPLTTINRPAALVAKFNPQDSLLWYKQISGTGSLWPMRARVDTAKHIYISGYFNGIADFDPDVGVAADTALPGVTKYFVAKYDSNLNYLWSYSIEDGYINNIVLDKGQNLLVYGNFHASVNFNPNGTAITKTSNGGEDIFLVRLDTSGLASDVYQIGSIGNDYPGTLNVLSNGDYYLTGNYKGQIDVDLKADTSYLALQGVTASFVAKYNQADSLLSRFRISGNNATVGGIALSPTDTSIYAVVNFSGTVDVDPTPTVTQYQSTGMYADMVVLKMDTNYNLIWSRFIDGSDYWLAGIVFPKRNDQITIIGFFSQSMTVAGQTYNSISSSMDIYRMDLGSTGNFLRYVKYGTKNSDGIAGLHMKKDESIYVSGFFRDSLPAGFNPSPVFMPGKSGEGMLIKFSACESRDTTLIIEACDSFQLPSGKVIYQSGVYLETLQANLPGCDSIVTYVADVIVFQDSIFYNQGFLQSVDTNVSYQWIKCPDSIIVDATGPAYRPPSNGQYAVVVSKGNCSDTSACLTVQDIGISEVQQQFEVFPNPTKNQLQINHPGIKTLKSIRLVNTLGKMQKMQVMSGENETILIFDLPAGAYVLQLETGQAFFNELIIIQ